jgi:hypothetical protein
MDGNDERGSGYQLIYTQKRPTIVSKETCMDGNDERSSIK